MPALARKILICAAVDGLILQPLSSRREQRPASPIRIRYGGDALIETLGRDTVADLTKNSPSFEAFGIIGRCSSWAMYYLDLCS